MLSSRSSRFGEPRTLFGQALPAAIFGTGGGSGGAGGRATTVADDATKGLMAQTDQRYRPALDTTVPHCARVWNHLSGGTDSYPPDRETGNRLLEIYPGMSDFVRAQRAFLARTVRHLVSEVGLRQFLHIGSGLPARENTHQLAQAIAPDSRIVYVDNDPLVLMHSAALLVGDPQGASDYVEADVRQPSMIFQQAARTLDFNRPVGLLMLGIMGLVSDEDAPHAVVHHYLDTLASGSHLVLCDGTDTDERLSAAIRAYNEHAINPYHLRDPKQIEGFFEGLEPVEPGVVPISMWRPEIPGPAPNGTPRSTAGQAGGEQASGHPLPEEIHVQGGVGRKE